MKTRKRRVAELKKMNENIDAWDDFFEALDDYIDFNIEQAFKSKEDDPSFYY